MPWWQWTPLSTVRGRYYKLNARYYKSVMRYRNTQNAAYEKHNSVGLAKYISLQNYVNFTKLYSYLTGAHESNTVNSNRPFDKGYIQDGSLLGHKYWQLQLSSIRTVVLQQLDYSTCFTADSFETSFLGWPRHATPRPHCSPNCL
jgi:hypothetical protein